MPGGSVTIEGTANPVSMVPAWPDEACRVGRTLAKARVVLRTSVWKGWEVASPVASVPLMCSLEPSRRRGISHPCVIVRALAMSRLIDSSYSVAQDSEKLGGERERER